MGHWSGVCGGSSLVNPQERHHGTDHIWTLCVLVAALVCCSCVAQVEVPAAGEGIPHPSVQSQETLSPISPVKAEGSEESPLLESVASSDSPTLVEPAVGSSPDSDSPSLDGPSLPTSPRAAALSADTEKVGAFSALAPWVQFHVNRTTSRVLFVIIMDHAYGAGAGCYAKYMRMLGVSAALAFFRQREAPAHRLCARPAPLPCLWAVPQFFDVELAILWLFRKPLEK
eukprot:RCo000053